jgi:outer membrane protein
MNKTMLSVLALFLIIHTSNAQAQDQNIEYLTLQDVIRLAKNQSTWALRAEVVKENRYWQYRVFKSNYNPQLRLSGELPNFQRTFQQVRQPTGDYQVRFINNNNSSLNLSLSQSVGLTGGEIFLNSEMRRFDDFTNDRIEYNTNPLFIGFRQPLFSFNPLLWDKKIEPLRYEESKREYVEDMEDISIEATRRFFNLMLAQVDIEIAAKNLANNDTIFKIAQGRYNLGNIAENELLQLELNLMNSRQSVAQANLDLETYSLRLKSYIGYTGNQAISLILPESIPQFAVNDKIALREALANRSEAIGFKREVLEAERDVAQAKGNAGLDANLFGSFGLTNRADEFDLLYANPSDQQAVRIGFEIPIVDWGRTKSRVKTAEANKKLAQFSVQQNRLQFEEEILTQVRRFNMLRNQIEITQKSSAIGQKSYNISKNRFLIGKISITDLNDALEKKDQARRRYIQSLDEFWTAYYEMRRLTLYDFADNEVLYKGE